MIANLTYQERLRSLTEQLKKQAVKDFLFNERPDQVMIKGSTVEDIFRVIYQIDGKVELKDEYVVGLTMEKIQELINLGLCSSKKMAEYDKICLDYLLQKIEDFPQA